MTPHANAHSEITKMLAIPSSRPGSHSPRARPAAVAALTMKHAISHATHGRIQDATPKIGFFRLRRRFATSVAGPCGFRHLTRTRSATATLSERQLKWKCFDHGKTFSRSG